MNPQVKERYQKALTTLVGVINLQTGTSFDENTFCKKHKVKPSFLLALRDMNCLFRMPVKGDTELPVYQRTADLLTITPEQVFAQEEAGPSVNWNPAIREYIRDLALLDELVEPDATAAEASPIVSHAEQVESSVSEEIVHITDLVDIVDLVDVGSMGPLQELNGTLIMDNERPVEGNIALVGDCTSRPEVERAIRSFEQGVHIVQQALSRAETPSDSLFKVVAGACETPASAEAVENCVLQITEHAPCDPDEQLRLFREVGQGLQLSMHTMADAIEANVDRQRQLAQRWREVAELVNANAIAL